MGKKFIPNGDLDFATMARAFATNFAKEPERFAATEADAAALTAAVERYAAALQAARSFGRSVATTREKERARGEAEQMIRRLANVVRATKTSDPTARIALGLRERTERPKQLACPQEPPRLRFVRAIHEGNAPPRHELAFMSLDHKSRPEGAVRLELFVGLMPPDELIPDGPGAGHASRAWYLRSYTRSPIVLVPPIARVPMRVVYWGRWAGTAGDVGPLSGTCVGWIEGGSDRCLPGGPGMRFGLDAKQIPILDVAAEQTAAAGRDRTYVVAVLEAQFRSLMPHAPAAGLLAADEREPRQLEGPVDAAA